VTLIELLCVLVIIGILMSLMLPAVARAFRLARNKVDEVEAPQIAFLLQERTQRYCFQQPRFWFTNKVDLAEKCNYPPKCREWVESARTEFVPFSYLTAETQIVLRVRIRAVDYAFTQRALTKTPD
jgi:prepilin-type N-terminal cleavage/methylation domain-containing protein